MFILTGLEYISEKFSYEFTKTSSTAVPYLLTKSPTPVGIKFENDEGIKLEIPDVQEFIKTKNSVVNINQLYTTTKFINFLKEKDYEWEISNDPFPIENYENNIDKKDSSKQIINYCKNSNYEKKDYIELIKSFCSLI